MWSGLLKAHNMRASMMQLQVTERRAVAGSRETRKKGENLAAVQGITSKCEDGLLSDMEEGLRSFQGGILGSFNLKNLQEFHLIGVDLLDSSLNIRGEEIIFLEEIAENLPKLKRLCFICQDIGHVDENYKRIGAFVSAKNIMLEFSSVFRNVGPCSCAQSWEHPINIRLGFGPKNLRKEIFTPESTVSITQNL